MSYRRAVVLLIVFAFIAAGGLELVLKAITLAAITVASYVAGGGVYAHP